MPVRQARGCGLGKYVIRQLRVVLKLDAFPILGKLFASDLRLEGRVVVFAVWKEQACKQDLVALFPRRLIPTHKIIGIHIGSR